ncbi:ABC transporter permease [Terriglobus saanensis]|uniref:Permease n=1 Tax=Terriglobus saanensis (strain ATCC BAA-1853 / DSM 23119 / SP1PR4) TaxID=401053 RepID=E8UY78_TERSS|nr:ABC transporter permease [Terriglobus saanensis]ADV80888.1 permease [Terriglobus saanensis SP1PR4]
MLADLRDALRQLRKSPGLTTTAVITLALGIGATTAIFTLVHQVMLKSLPVTKPEELWRIGDKIRCCNWGGYTQGDAGDFALFSWEAYKHFRSQTPEFVDLAALQAGNTSLGVRRAGVTGQPDTRNGQYVSGNFFRTFGIQPWIGRLTTDADDQVGAPLVAVMSYRIWQEKYGSDPSVVGAGFQINGHPFTVIGVAPPGFYGAKLSGGGMPDLWLPIAAEDTLAGSVSHLKRPQANYLDLIGRVRPGVDPKALEAKLRVEFHGWLASHVPDMEPNEKQLWAQQTLHIVPGGAGVSVMRDQYQDGLKLLLIAAGCVLLVACGNLANLMLARGLKDRAQVSIRMALGASRVRLIRKALVESVLMALIGGVLGVGVAYAGTRLILYLAFQVGGRNNYVAVSPTPSWPVLLFTLGISILTGMIFGTAPAWMTTHANPVEALRGANRSVGGGSSWAQKSLVVVQAAMSLVLVSAAALLAQSLRNLEHQDFGFETDGRYIASINPTLGTYKPEEMEPLFRRIDEQLKQVPGVRMAAPVLYAPMTGDSWNEGVRIAGRPEPPAKEDMGAGWARVMSGFFETVGAKMVLGRAFTDEDTATTRNVAVINEAFAKRFFKGQNPIGQHFGINRVKYAGSYEIVGVARDMRYMTYDYKDPIRPMFWVPETQTVQYDDPMFVEGEKWSHYLYNIVIWAPGNPPGMEERIRKALASVDSNLVVYNVDSYRKIFSMDFQQQNMIATLTSLFGALGLVLAAVGLYGVMAYAVEQRTSEIGLRMAFGAGRGDVIRMILRSASWQIGVGLGLGIPLAILAGKLMKDQLFGVSPGDPVMLAAAAALLILAALLSSVIPARRAAGVDPMVALRSE